MKTYILDTNILMQHPEAATELDNANVIIPLIVLKELDKAKSYKDIAGFNARRANRALEEIRQSGSLYEGVVINGSRISVFNSDHIVAEDNDKVILKVAQEVQEQTSDDVIILSNDISFRLICDAYDVTSMSYDEVYEFLPEWCSEVQVPGSVVDGLHSGKTEVYEVLSEAPIANECFIVRGENKQSCLTRYDATKSKLRVIKNPKSIYGISAKNKEQEFALDMLLDKDIDIVTLIGCAGTGKTLLALAAGLHSVIDKKRYDKVIVTRPICPLGNDIGFLPGTLEEKMSPWIGPIYDNLEVLFHTRNHKRKLDEMFRDGIIQIEAPTYIRGRSIPDAFFIIDEAQNLTRDELKTIITRAGQGTKIILTGDIEQIDSKTMNSQNNALLYLLDRFYDCAPSAFCELKRTERSRLAEMGARLL